MGIQEMGKTILLEDSGSVSINVYVNSFPPRGRNPVELMLYIGVPNGHASVYLSKEEAHRVYEEFGQLLAHAYGQDISDEMQGELSADEEARASHDREDFEARR